jgi:hypothetical protein
VRALHAPRLVDEEHDLKGIEQARLGGCGSQRAGAVAAGAASFVLFVASGRRYAAVVLTGRQMDRSV